MQQIFVNEEPLDGKFNISGQDAHHLTKVVRLRPGERIRVSAAGGDNYICRVSDFKDKTLEVTIVEKVLSTELPNKIYLFQAIPKGDRMETIIYIITHKKFDCPKLKGYKPLHVGRHVKEDLGYKGCLCPPPRNRLAERFYRQ